MVKLTHSYIVSLAAEGEAVEEKVVEKVGGRGVSFGGDVKPQ